MQEEEEEGGRDREGGKARERQRERTEKEGIANESNDKGDIPIHTLYQQICNNLTQYSYNEISEKIEKYDNHLSLSFSLSRITQTLTRSSSSSASQGRGGWEAASPACAPPTC